MKSHLLGAFNQYNFNVSRLPVGQGRETYNLPGFYDISHKYMLLAGLGSVRIGKNCDRGLENAARRRAVYKPFAKNLTSERATKSDAIEKDVLKNRFISNYFMLVHLVPQLRSLKLFSRYEISCKV